MSNIKKNNIRNILYSVGLMIILFIFLTLFVTNILFFLKISISKYNFIISLFLTLMISLIIFKKKNNNFKLIIIKLFAFVIILILTIFIANNTYDLSWDGNSYHKTAIGELKNGWNPIYENIEDFNSNNENQLQLAGTHDIWCNHYAKGHWIFAASIYSITDNIESGKCLNFLLIISVLFLSINFLTKRIKPFFGVILSIIIAINPITLMQMFTYYNDLLIYCLIVILIINMQKILNNDNRKLSYFMLFLTICILINIKFTGLAYAGIIMIIYYVFILLSKRYKRRDLKSMTILGITSIIIGLLFLGSSTYIKNYINNGNPLYPLFGENKVDIMTTNQPKSFANLNRIEKFIYANFSESRNITAFQNEEPTLKIPLTFNNDELLSLTIPDLRIGGFGVLFGGVLLLSIIVITVGMYFLYYKDKEMFKKIFIVLGTILFLILLLDESWWARYLPQVYLIPVISLLILYIFKYRKINKVIMCFIVIVLIINTGIIFKYNTIENIKKFNEIKNDLNILKTEEKLKVFTTDFNGAVYNIYDINNNICVLKKINEEENNIEYHYNNMIQLVK